ncbi:hypothetical protein MNB_SM-5-158 [hydrothermal vent metagenome]|uniref:Uncharacterized protein n=1 Tax=hydrothermal vent metagenome TaxID=652676 RepID=A0A1W1BXS7_9ZZZZ
MQLTIDEYSKEYKISKEEILLQIENKQLHTIVKNGITYIETETKPTQKKRKPTIGMVLALYRRENQQLKEKIIQLEQKIDKLIDDKEQMLRDEMNKIEQVYHAKDEQLKTILDLVNKKLLIEQKCVTTHQEVKSLTRDKNRDAKDIEVVDEIVELKEYLKTLDIEPHQRKIIKKRFLSIYNSDIRIIKQNGKLYLNFSKYDYSDLLE